MACGAAERAGRMIGVSKSMVSKSLGLCALPRPGANVGRRTPRVCRITEVCRRGCRYSQCVAGVRLLRRGVALAAARPGSAFMGRSSMRKRTMIGSARRHVSSVSRLCMVGTVLAGALSAAYGEEPVGGVVWHRDLRTAAMEAKRRGKPLFVEISASWCGYCRRLKSETLRNRSVLRHLRECFVPVEIDADRQAALVEAVGVEGLPTMLIVDPDMNVLRRITGYRSAAQLDVTLESVCRHLRKADQRSGGQTGSTTGRRVSSRAAAVPRAGVGAASGSETRTSDRRGAVSSPRVDHGAADEVHRGVPPTASVAFGGHCLVSMLEEETLRRGRPEHRAVYRGRELWFHSEEARRRFLADPRRYWPAADGADIVAYVERGERRAADVRLTLVYKGRLWFFSDRTSQKAFLADPDRYVDRAVALAPRSDAR
ncbi:MAG: DUF255 domain-containing protein [Planctomycetota bacterium]|nr:MAG: DUF255 domain-containing protein [Planctomycetota bacterium]